MVRQSFPHGVTMTREWRDPPRTMVLAKMLSDSLDVGLEKGMQIQSSGLVRTADVVYVISRKQDAFCTMPQNLQQSQVADRLLLFFY